MLKFRNPKSNHDTGINNLTQMQGQNGLKGPNN